MNPVPPRGLRPVPSDPFGLIAWLEETRVVLPLKAVDVTFNAAGDLAEVSLDQVFHQTAPRPLDVLYTFPLPAGAAVFRCELIVNDRVIAARVEEQDRAREIARQMKAEGRRTGLVEMERDNLFTLSLGNVQPGDLVIVRFAWFQVLDHALDQKSLAIPFTPGLRYIPGRPLLRANRGAGVEDDTDQVPDASRISPPRIDQLHPDAALVSITGTIDARFADPASVSSATHPVLVRESGSALDVTLPLEGHVPDRDFIVRWKERATTALDLRPLSCVDGDAQYAVVRLDAPADAPVAAEKAHDYYFLVDRSGSMEGAKWTCTARALRAFVDELGAQDRVWVTLFQSTFQDYAEAPLPVAELRRDPAFAALERLGVDGGTELLPALEHVLQAIGAHSRGRSPVVILITDGQVGNEAAVLELLRARRDLPVHTFGIDTAVNDGFLKQLAAQHRGACVLMTPNDDIAGAVSRLGSRLRRPVLTGITVAGGWETVWPQLPDLHGDEHLLIALKGARTADSLELTGRLADGTARSFRFVPRPEPIAGPRLLWAREAIDRCLAEHRDKDAIELAIRNNVICRGTAFIAYDLKERVAVAPQQLYQPALAPAYAPAPMPAAPVAQVIASGMHRRGARYGGTPKARSAGLPSLSGILSKTKRLFTSSSRGGGDRGVDDPLQEIRARHLAGGAPPSLRTQILVDGWSAKAAAVPVFRSPAGELIRDLLGRWAAQDVAARLPLLEALLGDLAAADARSVLRKFVDRQVRDARLAEDLALLIDVAGRSVR